MVDAGKFLKRISPEEVNLGDTVEVLNEGYAEEATFATSQRRQRLILPVRFKGVEREIALGSSSIRRIVKAYGFETSSWVGRKLRVAEKREAAIEGRKVVYLVWEPAEKAGSPETVNCPNCGRTVTVGAKFCPYCGFKLGG